MTEDNRIPEPLTRDAVLARVIEEANEQVDDDWTTADTLAFREYFGERLATRLAEAGLLADPEQHTELERARTQRNEAMETAGQLRDEVHQHQVAAANLYGRVFVALGLSITDPWAGLADAAAKVRAERDERQARIDRALEWWRQERDADHSWPLSLEESAKVNSLRYRVYAALTGHPLAEQPMPAKEPAPLSGVALRDVEERDDAAGDLP